jgi:hypothetical protein
MIAIYVLMRVVRYARRKRDVADISEEERLADKAAAQEYISWLARGSSNEKGMPQVFPEPVRRKAPPKF